MAETVEDVCAGSKSDDHYCCRHKTQHSFPSELTPGW